MKECERRLVASFGKSKSRMLASEGFDVLRELSASKASERTKVREVLKLPPLSA